MKEPVLVVCLDCGWMRSRVLVPVCACGETAWKPAPPPNDEKLKTPPPED